MEKNEIKIIFREQGIGVEAHIHNSVKPSELIEGPLAHLSTVAQILEAKDEEVLFFLTSLHMALREDPDALHKEMVEIRIPKGLNLNGKEDNDG